MFTASRGCSSFRQLKRRLAEASTYIAQCTGISRPYVVCMPTSSGPPLHRYVTSPAAGHRDEGAQPGPQHVFTQHRIRVQPQFGSAEEAEAQVQHLQRQAVAQRVFVLAHEAAALEDGEQPMHRRRGLAQHPRQVGHAQTALRGRERLADVERLFQRRVPAGPFGGRRLRQWLRCV